MVEEKIPTQLVFITMLFIAYDCFTKNQCDLEMLFPFDLSQNTIEYKLYCSWFYILTIILKLVCIKRSKYYQNC